KVCIEDGYKFALRNIKALIERAGFISMPVAAVEIHNRLRSHAGKSACVSLNDLLCHFCRLIGRVIQHLNLKSVTRIVQLANRIDQTVDDELLVEDRQLDGHKRQLSVCKPV